MPEDAELGSEGRQPDLVDRFFGVLQPPSRRIALASLPVTYEDRPVKAAAGSLIFGSFFVAMSVFMAAMLAVQLLKRFDWLTFAILIAPLAFLVVGAFVCIGGVLLLFRRTSISITREHVSVGHQSLRSKQEWSEPLSEYRGVLMRVVKPKYRKEASFVLELHHPNPSRAVLLFASGEPLETMLQWQPACAALDLPPYSQVDGVAIRDDEAFQGKGEETQPPSETAEALSPDDPFLREKRSAETAETPEMRRALRKARRVNAIGMLILVAVELFFLGSGGYSLYVVGRYWRRLSILQAEGRVVDGLVERKRTREGYRSGTRHIVEYSFDRTERERPEPRTPLERELLESVWDLRHGAEWGADVVSREMYNSLHVHARTPVTIHPTRTDLHTVGLVDAERVRGAPWVMSFEAFTGVVFVLAGAALPVSLLISRARRRKLSDQLRAQQLERTR